MKKNIKKYFTVSFIIYCLLITISCHDFIEMEKQNEGNGSFTLTLGASGTARTILPNTVQNDFSAYTLEFYITGTKTLAFPIVERTNDNLSAEVLLSVGSYDIYVCAYMDTGKTKLAAKGELNNIIINKGINTTRNIVLLPISDGINKGIFRYRITSPSNVVETSMTIMRLPINHDNETQTIYFSSPSFKEDIIELYTGYYRVTFKLKNNLGLVAERREILHIYENMISTFTYTFDDTQFTNPANVNIVPGTSLAEKLLWLQENAQSDTNYTIEVETNENINPATLSYRGRNNISIILKSADVECVIGLLSNGALFSIWDGVTLILENIVLQGRSGNSASLINIYSGGTLEMNEGEITGSTGSGVSVYGAFVMNGGKIINNVSTYYYSGGGVTIGGGDGEIGSFIMNGGEISSNTSNFGGVFLSEGVFTMNNGRISYNNSTSEVGGGVYVRKGIFTMNSGEITHNTECGVFIEKITTSYNGIVHTTEGTFIMNSGKISGNTSGGGGGGVYVCGTCNMYGGEISGNTSGGEGGGVYVHGIFNMYNGKILNNVSTGSRSWSSGGGVSTYGSFTMNNGEISGNIASWGGGVSVSGTFIMNNGLISNNISNDTDYGESGGGGGVYATGYNFVNFIMNNGEISGNASTGSGGGVYAERTFNMHGGKISGNTSASVGGGIYGSFRISNGIIYGSSEVEKIRNNAKTGASFYSRSLATYGKFNDNLWVSNGTLETTNETIEVIDGVLILHTPLTIVALSSVTANGSPTQTTTQLTLTFENAITGLTSNDITLSGVSGANNITKTLSGAGHTYTLTLGNIIEGGNLTVVVTKFGYTISGSPYSVNIYHHIPVVVLSSVTANGSSTQTTTQLSLTFDQEIPGLTANDITLGGVSGANNITKTLSGSGHTYSLILSNISTGGDLTVTVAKSGFIISGSPYTIAIYHYTPPITVTGVSLNPTSASIEVGGTRTLTATITPSNAANKNLTWSSSNNNIATVSTSGLVRAIAPGTATITVISVDGGYQATCNVTVQDYQNGHTFIVTDSSSWNNAVNVIRNSGNNRNWNITIAYKISISGTTTNTFGSVTGLNVTINGGYVLGLNSNGSLLRITAEQTVIIDNVYIEGQWSTTPNSYPLVWIGGTNAHFIMKRYASVSGNNMYIYGSGYVVNGGGIYLASGGTLTMEDYSQVSNNQAVSAGGGVFVSYGATFNMRGNASVSGNATSYNSNGNHQSGGGGGVNVSGTFNMEGGYVEHNSSFNGGGVYVNSSGSIFNMMNGILRNNDATNAGGGVYADYGSFIMSGGTIYGFGSNAGNRIVDTIQNDSNNGAALYAIGSLAARYGNGTNILPHIDNHNNRTNYTITGK